MDTATIVRVLAILFVVLGFVLALQPEVFKGLLRFIVKGRVLYLVGVIRVLVGILFIWVGGRLHAPVLGVLGAVIVVAGITNLVVKLDTQRGWVRWILERSETVHRVIGIMAAMIGALIFLETFVRW